MIRNRLGDTQTIVSANIVSAVDADTGTPLDPGSFGVYTCAAGETCGSGSGSGTVGQAGSPSGSGNKPTGGNFGLGLGNGSLTLPDPLAKYANLLAWLGIALVALIALSALSGDRGRR